MESLKMQYKWIMIFLGQKLLKLFINCYLDKNYVITSSPCILCRIIMVSLKCTWIMIFYICTYNKSQLLLQKSKIFFAIREQVRKKRLKEANLLSPSLPKL